MMLAYSVERIADSKKRNFIIFYTLNAIRYPLILISLFCVFLALLLNAEAAPTVTAQELLENEQQYDGKTVVYKGEVIGDMMIRGDSAWINVRDETGALGVFCPRQLLDKLQYQGSYKFSGDIVSVQGEFHRFCQQHGGDTDIHAKKLTLIQQGKARTHALEPKKVKTSIILAAITLLLASIHLIIRRWR